MPADTRLWHAFADMHAVRGNEFVIARGDGAYVWDEDGKRYLDGTASLWCVNVGHGRDEIVEAAMAQMRELASYQTFGVFANRPALDLAERLADLAPLDDPRIFLGSGGGDAIDTAAKLARRYFAAIGTPERTHLISRSQGYHGTHGLGTSIGGIPANRQDVGPLDPDASVVPYDSLEALEAEIERVGADRVAAVFVEPVIGAGGVRQPAPGYIEGVAELCARTGVLFVCDSVIAGFGRLGTWFGIERWDVRARHAHLRQGRDQRLPAARRRRRRRQGRGALLGGRRLVPPRPDLLRAPDRVRRRDGQPRHHRARGPARPRARARGRDRLGAAPAGRPPAGGRDPHRHRRPGRDRLRRPRRWPRRPTCRRACSRALRERGVLLRPLGDGLAFSPPLVITREQVDHVAEVAGEALEAVARDVPAAVGAR